MVLIMVHSMYVFRRLGNGPESICASWSGIALIRPPRDPRLSVDIVFLCGLLCCVDALVNVNKNDYKKRIANQLARKLRWTSIPDPVLRYSAETPSTTLS